MCVGGLSEYMSCTKWLLCALRGHKEGVKSEVKKVVNYYGDVGNQTWLFGREAHFLNH